MCCVGVCVGWEPKGGGPKGEAPKMGALQAEVQRGGELEGVGGLEGRGGPNPEKGRA